MVNDRSPAEAGLVGKLVASQGLVSLGCLEKLDEDAEAASVLVAEVEQAERIPKPLELFVEVAPDRLSDADDRDALMGDRKGDGCHEIAGEGGLYKICPKTLNITCLS